MYNIPFIVGWRCIELIFDCDFVLESDKSDSAEDTGEDEPLIIVISSSGMNSVIYLTRDSCENVLGKGKSDATKSN